MTSAKPGTARSERAVEYGKRFGTELRRAMTTRGVSLASLAETLHTSRSSMSVVRRGALPYHATAIRYAEALNWPALVDITLEARRLDCAECGHEFIDGSPGLRASFCSPKCKNLARHAAKKQHRFVRIANTEHDNEEMRKAIAAFCWSCEPDGFCRNAAAIVDGEDCKFRPFTPLSIGAKPLPVLEAPATLSPARRRANTKRRERALHRDWMRQQRAASVTRVA